MIKGMELYRSDDLQ